jgi:hypothetical protein
MNHTVCFDKTLLEFDNKTRIVNLPNSDKRKHINHCVKIVNTGTTKLLLVTTNKKWGLSSGKYVFLTYNGINWIRTTTGPATMTNNKSYYLPDDSTSSESEKQNSCSSSSDEEKSKESKSDSDSDNECDKDNSDKDNSDKDNTDKDNSDKDNSDNNDKNSCRKTRGPRGPRGRRGKKGRSGCNGRNGFNGKDGKDGVCECHNSTFLLIDYQGTADHYNTTVAVPSWAHTATVTSVAGGGAGGPGGGGNIPPGRSGGIGGGSGFSITQNIAVSGSILNLSIGRGGRSTVANQGNGQDTSVTYTGLIPFTVYAPPGSSGSLALQAPASHAGDGMYGGGGADGDPPLPPGNGFQDGDPAIPEVKGGNGGGINAGLGGISSQVTSVISLFGGGGGGGSPGPINGAGGNGGGLVGQTTVYNGTAGTRGAGGGGGAALIADADSIYGTGGNGGDGYVTISFFP